MTLKSRRNDFLLIFMYYTISRLCYPSLIVKPLFLGKSRKILMESSIETWIIRNFLMLDRYYDFQDSNTMTLKSRRNDFLLIFMYYTISRLCYPSLNVKPLFLGKSWKILMESNIEIWIIRKFHMLEDSLYKLPVNRNFGIVYQSHHRKFKFFHAHL